ncbi:MAG: hypothetical protein QOD41_4274 [Cryptosporangiaceae bacterium]|nr:hypothetical protein [Cryptosporangiaceae bacterium]
MLDKDTITRPVVEAALEMIGQSPHDRESEKYLELIRPREYECLAAAAMENVECGNSAVLAAPFIREFGDEAWLQRTQAAYEAKNAATYVRLGLLRREHHADVHPAQGSGTGRR